MRKAAYNTLLIKCKTSGCTRVYMRAEVCFHCIIFFFVPARSLKFMVHETGRDRGGFV